MLKRLLAGAVLSLLTCPANAKPSLESLLGKKLVEAMREYDRRDMGQPNSDPYMVGFYTGYVAGAYDAYDSAGVLCGTDQVTQGQAWRTVSRYLKANPAEWNLPAIYLVRHALQSEFPCPK